MDSDQAAELAALRAQVASLTASVTDHDFSIGTLKGNCIILEARVAALTAFACAILQSNPRRDELQTRWGKHLGPALSMFAGTEKTQTDAGSAVPGWVMYRLQGEPAPGSD